MPKGLLSRITPSFVKNFLKNRDPYYREQLELRKQLDDAGKEIAACKDDARKKDAEMAACREQLAAARNETAACREQLEAARNEIAGCRSVIEAKDKDIISIDAAYKEQLAERQKLIEAKDRDIISIDAAYKEQLADCRKTIEAKDKEICRVDAVYREQLDAVRAEVAEWRKTVEAKDKEICRITAEYLKYSAGAKAALKEKNEEIGKHLKVYQDSLKHVFSDPSVREDHLCSICGKPMKFSFSKKVMDKYDVAYFYCDACDHLQTEKPYWLEEAYNSPLSDSDTGQIWRNERARGLTSAVLQKFFKPDAKVLEYAGGYGLLTRMMRDAGADCFWYDKYASNTFARHFEDDGKSRYDLVLAFEAIEHFEEPMKEFENIFSRCDSLLFSEEPLTESCPDQWWYLCSEHGQHVNFYSVKTLSFIAERFHKKLYFHENVGLITSLEISQEDFDDMFSHVEELEKKFRDSHSPRTSADMEAVIKEMSGK